MSAKRDLEHISESVDEMFSRLGLPDPSLMAAVSVEWDDLAGAPWSNRSRPVFMRGRTLVVEASSRSMIAFLRYDESRLMDRLEARFGKGKIEAIDIQSPTGN